MSVETLRSDDEAKVSAALQSIIANPDVVCLSSKSQVMDVLLARLEKNEWQGQVNLQAIQALKLLGRTITGSDVLFAEKGFVSLMCIAGLGTRDKGNGGAPTAFVDDECSHEALKCVYNCIFLDDKVKPYFEQCGGIAASCRWLAQKNVSIEVQFLLCRILFFVAVHRADIIDQLIQHDIATSAEMILNENVEKLVADPSVKDHGVINPSTVTTEVLKLLFGINLACPSGKQQENDESKEGRSYRELLKGCLVPIFKLTFRLPAPQPLPMAAPLSHAIHVLMQYPYRSMHEVWTEHYTQLVPRPMSLDESHTYLVDALIALLRDTIGYLIPTGNPDDATPADRAQHNIDACLSPLILVIQSIVQDDVVARAQFAHALLPQQEDREQPVHQGKRLAASLIRLMTCTMLPQTRDAISETLFVLCDENASKFSQQVGYGNAIGFLVNKGIAMEPPSAADGADDGPGGSHSGGHRPVHPITGQYLDVQDDGPSLAEMTDEEKEREAERLFVLFERLKKTGVVNVENPVAKAYQQASASKITEVHDASDDDDDD